MRPIIVTSFVSLDGVMDSPGGGDHPHAGWTFKDVEFEESAYELKGREQEEAGALLMGRQTYTEFSPIWPTMDDFARYNSLPKYVVSTTLDAETVAADPWGVELLPDLDAVARLKETEGGQIQVHGSAHLAQSLAAAGLVDAYHLLVFPILLGSGKRLWADDADKSLLRVTEAKHFDNGIQQLCLEVRR